MYFIVLANSPLDKKVVAFDSNVYDIVDCLDTFTSHYGFEYAVIECISEGRIDENKLISRCWYKLGSNENVEVNEEDVSFAKSLPVGFSGMWSF